MGAEVTPAHRYPLLIVFNVSLKLLQRLQNLPLRCKDGVFYFYIELTTLITKYFVSSARFTWLPRRASRPAVGRLVILGDGI
jgi:hypothetical protein